MSHRIDMPFTPEPSRDVSERDFWCDPSLETALRLQAIEHPLDPSPIVQLGYIELARRGADGSRLHFEDAVRLAPDCEGARLGLALLDFVETGDRTDLLRHPLPLRPGERGVPGPFDRAMRWAAASESVAGGGLGDGLDPSLRAIAGENVARRARLDTVSGRAVRPAAGRESVLESVARALATRPYQSIVLRCDPRVSGAAVLDALAVPLAELLGRAGCLLWRAAGELREHAGTLGRARERGNVFLHADSGVALAGVSESGLAAVFGSGALLFALPARELDRLRAAAPSCFRHLFEIPVRALTVQAAAAALEQSRPALQPWLGFPIDCGFLSVCAGMAGQLLPDAALPEAAVELAECASREARALGRPDIDEEALGAALSRRARVPVECLERLQDLDAIALGDSLHARLGSQREACRAVARAAAYGCAVHGTKGSVERPDVAMLFAGPSGTGKARLARQLGLLLYGPEHFFELDLASAAFEHGGDPLRGLREFLLTRTFGVLHVRHLETAPEAIVAALSRALETGLLETGGAPISLRRSVVVLSMETAEGGRGPGFESASEPTSRSRLSARLLPAGRFLLETARAVWFHSLSERETRQVVRLRLNALVVDWLRENRGLEARIDDGVVVLLARRARADRATGARLDELIHEAVLQPIWPSLGEARSGLRLTEIGGDLIWELGAETRPAAKPRLTN